LTIYQLYYIDRQDIAMKNRIIIKGDIMIRKKTYKQRKVKAIKNLAQYKNSDGTQKENKIEKSA
jgi:hypothetical protein